MGLKFFIAYESTAGKHIAENLKKSLERHKKDVTEAFIARDDIPKGEKNEREYRYKKIEEADYFVLIYAPFCINKSDELKEEIEKAKEVERKKERFILIAKHKDATLPADLGPYQRITSDFVEGPDVALAFDSSLPRLLQQRGKFKEAEKNYEKITTKTVEINSVAVPVTHPISVIIPVRGEIEKLDFCLESLSKQSHTPDEIIIIDDNSTSHPIGLIERYKEKGLKIHYEKLPHDVDNLSRRALARQVGTYLAKSELIIYLDQDTLLAPKTIAELLRQASENHVLLPQHYQLPIEIENRGRGTVINYVSRSPKKRILLQNYSINKSLDFNLDPFNVHWQAAPFNCVLVEKTWINKIGGFDLRYAGYGYEDTDVKYRLHKAGLKFREVILENCASYHIEPRFTPVETKQRESELKENEKYFIKKFPEFIWTA